MSKAGVKQGLGVFFGLAIGLFLGAGIQGRSQAKKDANPAESQRPPLVEIVMPKAANMAPLSVNLNGPGPNYLKLKDHKTPSEIDAASATIKCANGATVMLRGAWFEVRNEQPNGEAHITVRPSTKQGIAPSPPPSVKPSPDLTSDPGSR